MSNGKNANNGNKLRTYRLYKSNFQTETYVKINMSRDQRRILSKFRCCNLPLAIETGRYTKPKTPLNERTCKFCPTSPVEDETHFFIECDFYSDIRYDLFEAASKLHENFYSFNSTEKLCFIMNSDRLHFTVANCLQSMFKRRKHANN